MISQKNNLTFICIGAARSGTTALYRWLENHPSLHLSPVKETNYFCHDLMHLNGPRDKEFIPSINTTDSIIKHIGAGIVSNESTYNNLIAGPSGTLSGEFSPAYMFYANKCAMRIARHSPQTKIIAILREPSDRAISNYLILRKWNRENHSILDALREEDARIRSGWEHAWAYYRLGCYYSQLVSYLSWFPRKQILVLLFEEMKEDPTSTLSKIYNFLGIRNISVDTHEPVNTSAQLAPLQRVVRKLNLSKVASMAPSFVSSSALWVDQQIERRLQHRLFRELVEARKLLRHRYQREVTLLARTFPALPVSEYWHYPRGYA